MHKRFDRHRVGLIGTGMVGASFAHALMQRGVAENKGVIQ